MIDANETNKNEELFSLFSSTNEINALLAFLNETSFAKIKEYNNYESFNDYLKEIGFYKLPEINRKLLYCSYLFDYFIFISTCGNSSSDNNYVLSPDKIISYHERIEHDPSCIILYYYSARYLLTKNRYYLYSDYSKIKTVRHKDYIQYNTNTEEKYFHLNNKKFNNFIDKNATRKIKNINNNYFNCLVNYKRGYAKTHDNMYFINKFLHQISFEIAEKSLTLKLDIIKDLSSNKNKLQKFTNLLYDSFFDLTGKLYNKDNILYSILCLYKLEYGFGVFSFFSFLYKSHTQLEPLNDFMPKLKRLQQNPMVYSPLKYECSELFTNFQNNEDYSEFQEISMVSDKVTFAILYNLYDNNLKDLTSDLGIYIKENYSNALNIFNINPYNNCCPMNGWYTMYTLFNHISSREHFIKKTQTIIASLEESTRNNLYEYFIYRYSNTWFKEIKQLFSIDAIDFLKKQGISKYTNPM